MHVTEGFGRFAALGLERPITPRQPRLQTMRGTTKQERPPWWRPEFTGGRYWIWGAVASLPRCPRAAASLRSGSNSRWLFDSLAGSNHAGAINKKGRRGGDLCVLVDATGFEPVTPAV